MWIWHHHHHINKDEKMLAGDLLEWNLWTSSFCCLIFFCYQKMSTQKKLFETFSCYFLNGSIFHLVFKKNYKTINTLQNPPKNPNPRKILVLPRIIIIKMQNKKMKQRSICLSQKWKHVFSRVVVVQKKSIILF